MQTRSWLGIQKERVHYTRPHLRFQRFSAFGEDVDHILIISEQVVANWANAIAEGLQREINDLLRVLKMSSFSMQSLSRCEDIFVLKTVRAFKRFLLTFMFELSVQILIEFAEDVWGKFKEFEHRLLAISWLLESLSYARSRTHHYFIQ